MKAKITFVETTPRSLIATLPGEWLKDKMSELWPNTHWMRIYEGLSDVEIRHGLEIIDDAEPVRLVFKWYATDIEEFSQSTAIKSIMKDRVKIECWKIQADTDTLCIELRA